jgi:hypothetical protein
MNRHIRKEIYINNITNQKLNAMQKIHVSILINKRDFFKDLD